MAAVRLDEGYTRVCRGAPIRVYRGKARIVETAPIGPSLKRGNDALYGLSLQWKGAECLNTGGWPASKE
jgi:hypothetical protein